MNLKCFFVNALSRRIPHRNITCTLLRDETQTDQSNIEHEQRIDGQRHPVLHHSTTSKDAHAGCKRPEAEDRVDRYSDDHRDVERGEEGGEDEWEESISNDADGLEEGAKSEVSVILVVSVVEKTYMLPPRSFICNVTMASAIHTVAKTPLKTRER